MPAQSRRVAVYSALRGGDCHPGPHRIQFRRFCNAPSLRVPVERNLARERALERKDMNLKAGDVAPDFEVPAVVGDTKTRFRLSNFRGRRHVVLAFYALDWTPT